MEIMLNGNDIKPFVYDYNYENYLKSYESYLRCLNCHANFKSLENSITTQSFAKFNQIKIAPKTSINDLDLDFHSLSQGTGLNKLKKLHDLMQNHYNSCDGLITDSEYLDALENFKEMEYRYKKGIDIFEI